jgi:hypothetical protein
VPIPITERSVGGPVDLELDTGDHRWHAATLRLVGALAPTAERRVLDARFGALVLRAVGLPAAARPGARFPVDLHWQADSSRQPTGSPADEPAVAAATVVFVHLLGPARTDGSTVWHAADGPPTFGAWPAAGDPQMSYLDRHIVAVPHEAPPGTYELEAGLYDQLSLERVDVTGADADGAARRVLLGTVEIRP